MSLQTEVRVCISQQSRYSQDYLALYGFDGAALSCEQAPNETRAASTLFLDGNPPSWYVAVFVLKMLV